MQHKKHSLSLNCGEVQNFLTNLQAQMELKHNSNEHMHLDILEHVLFKPRTLNRIDGSDTKNEKENQGAIKRQSD